MSQKRWAREREKFKKDFVCVLCHQNRETFEQRRGFSRLPWQPALCANCFLASPVSVLCLLHTESPGCLHTTVAKLAKSFFFFLGGGHLKVNDGHEWRGF